MRTGSTTMTSATRVPALAPAACERSGAGNLPAAPHARADAPCAYVRLDRQPGVWPDARTRPVRLVLFGFAGGTITALLSLARALPAWVEVWGAEYPGRGMRWQDPLLERIEPLLDDLRPGLARLSDRPVALLGYSMGAHVAYHLAQRAAVAPLGVIAISARPPCRGASDWTTGPMSDAELIGRLRALGGIPAEILDSRVWMDSFMPVMRADLALCADLNRFAAVPLPCPVLALEGSQDRLLADAQVCRWLEVAPGRDRRSRHRAYPGGHFFHKGREGEVARDIAGWLDTLRAAAAPTDPTRAAFAHALSQR